MILTLVLLCTMLSADDSSGAAIAREVHGLGRIAYSAVGPHGDWDLSIMRPDGTDRRQLTDTRDLNETGVRFSPDGKHILYYEQPASDPVDNNTYGTYDLVIADSTGSNPVRLGRGLSWASWGPDSKTVSVLTPRGILTIEVPSRKLVHNIPRQGIVQQLVCSPDGRSLTGTANGLGPYWNVGILDMSSRKIALVSEAERYNCTPDWLPDARHVIYARGTIPERNERAQLWIAGPGGAERRMVYAEAGRHIYGGASSPDGRYYLFTRSVEDLGKVDHARTTMSIIRAADTPMLGDDDPALRSRFPDAKYTLRLDLGPGWEPHWTAAEIEWTSSP